MIQFNLLPDVKIEYIKAKRLKRTVLAVSVLVTASAIALMAVMGTLVAAQKAHLGDLNKDIKTSEDNLRNTPDLNKVLTIQNQLSALPDLYKKRPVTSRLFHVLEQTTPKEITINHLILDFEDNSIRVEGVASSFAATTQYADTLKFTEMVVTEGETANAPVPAFKDVLLSSFDRGEKSASYNITFKFDPVLFDETKKKVEVQVPNQVTTRSVTERPLFEAEN